MLIDSYLLQINDTILLAFTLFLCVLVTIRSIYFRKKSAIQQTKLQATSTSLNNAKQELDKLRRLDKRFTDFQSNLSKAELTTHFQKPRLAFNNQNQNCQPPERYQFIHSLTEKGISSPDIASILSISSQEAEQLVTLAGLTKR